MWFQRLAAVDEDEDLESGTEAARLARQRLAQRRRRGGPDEGLQPESSVAWSLGSGQGGGGRSQDYGRGQSTGAQSGQTQGARPRAKVSPVAEGGASSDAPCQAAGGPQASDRMPAAGDGAADATGGLGEVRIGEGRGAVYEEAFQFERYSAPLKSWGSSFPGHRLQQDPRPWTSRLLKGGGDTPEQWPLPPGWAWSDAEKRGQAAWRVDGQASQLCGKGGWMYAHGLTELQSMQVQPETKQQLKLTAKHAQVRWRRHVRLRVLTNAAADQPGDQPGDRPGDRPGDQPEGLHLERELINAMPHGANPAGRPAGTLPEASILREGWLARSRRETHRAAWR